MTIVTDRSMCRPSGASWPNPSGLQAGRQPGRGVSFTSPRQEHAFCQAADPKPDVTRAVKGVVKGGVPVSAIRAVRINPQGVIEVYSPPPNGRCRASG